MAHSVVGVTEFCLEAIHVVSVLPCLCHQACCYLCRNNINQSGTDTTATTTVLEITTATATSQHHKNHQQATNTINNILP